MEKIEIFGELDRLWIVSLLAEGFDTYQILKNYQLTEKLIEECSDLLDKEVLLQGFNFTEGFIRKSLDSAFFTYSDIQNLNMSTYASLSYSFVKEFSEVLNWNRILVYLSTQTNSFADYVSIIEEKNLWSIISANDLPVDFIRKYQEKLDWNLLSMTKCFTEDERKEFQNFIVEKNNDYDENDFENSITNLGIYTEKEYSVDEIADMIDKYMQDINKNFYTKSN